MEPEKQRLIEELFGGGDPGATRESALVAGGSVLRRKRLRRVVLRSIGALAVAVIVVTGILSRLEPPPRSEAPVTPKVVQSLPEVHQLSDEELLDLFPGVPVALATINRKQRLIFLRPGDEQRFVENF